MEGESDRAQGENKKVLEGWKTKVPKGGGKRNLEGEKKRLRGWEKKDGEKSIVQG